MMISLAAVWIGRIIRGGHNGRRSLAALMNRFGHCDAEAVLLCGTDGSLVENAGMFHCVP